jgi:hypothetical protein
MWADPSKLTILSYHNSLGTVIADAIDPATGVIRPITDGPVDTRRPADVAFAKVRLEIDFQELHYKNDPCTARFTYFIPLPVGEITFTNAAGGATTRTTCTIPGNPFDLSAEQFRDQVLTPGSVIGPASIADPKLGFSICVIEYAKTIRKIHQDVIALGFESIFQTLLEQAAPGFSNSAHATVEKIKQCFIDKDGNSICLRILEYYNAMINASAPFTNNKTFPYNMAIYWLR